MEKGMRAVSLALLLLASVAFAACETEGPLERAGARADRQVEAVRDAVDNDGNGSY